MKRFVFLFLKPSIYGYVLGFLLVLLFGCDSQDNVFLSEEPTAVASLLTVTRQPTQPSNTIPITPTFTKTVGAASTSSLASILTPSQTPAIAPFSTPSISPMPTLTNSQTEIWLKEFITTNGRCALPCWWGIHLGDSFTNANQTFIGFGLGPMIVTRSVKVQSDRMGTQKIGYYDEASFNYRVDVNMEFHEMGNSIEYIFVHVTHANSDQAKQEFVRDWGQYYISAFLQDYGKPTQVYFRITSVGDFMPVPQYSVSLLYLDTGLAVTYHLGGRWVDTSYTRGEVCLNIENVISIELSLFNPAGFDRWGYQFAPYHDEAYKKLTWETQIGMSLDEFYERYKHPENLNCVVEK